MESASPPLSVMFMQIGDVYAVNIAAAGALTWLVYDIVLTASLELSMLVRTRWTFTKVLYCFIRYYTVFTLSINLTGNCQRWFWFIGYNGPVLSTAIGECLLLIRVNALYGYNRRVIILTSSLYLAETVLGFTTVAVEISSITVLPRTAATPVPGCLATSPPRIKLTLAAWIMALVVASVFFVLSLFKFFAYMPSVQMGKPTSFKDILQARKIMPTLSLFIRDNSFFFFFAFSLQLINLVFIVGLAERPIQQMGTAWLMAGYAVMASRLMLNIRTISDLVDVGESFELDSRFQSRSTVRFAVGITQGTDPSNHD
ncbi:hypothetical protein EDD18DRAFT_184560 [Armillaria luteobubalina]|uniref:DUF6533 domain-containing protein n=1 Tax=Armillaria luteobubalina TaxID=153913 RepID=A0AA39Q7Z8_9AGAR|nr:hypothetical protein EDD18DRAFT_184560 [Armillaria luteobubalina]